MEIIGFDWYPNAQHNVQWKAFVQIHQQLNEARWHATLNRIQTNYSLQKYIWTHTREKKLCISGENGSLDECSLMSVCVCVFEDGKYINRAILHNRSIAIQSLRFWTNSCWSHTNIHSTKSFHHSRSGIHIMQMTNLTFWHITVFYIFLFFLFLLWFCFDSALILLVIWCVRHCAKIGCTMNWLVTKWTTDGFTYNGLSYADNGQMTINVKLPV